MGDFGMVAQPPMLQEYDMLQSMQVSSSSGSRCCEGKEELVIEEEWQFAFYDVMKEDGWCVGSGVGVLIGSRGRGTNASDDDDESPPSGDGGRGE